MTQNQAFKALNRICLNNWHYIDKKILSFSRGINFFTGHSGSGKSTVIDAMQIVLYANTDGRGFFNKAAADDSDRSLVEYLRGMVNIGENNQAEYKRNHNFSTTIVLELEQTQTGEKECVGVVFDVTAATNDISRLFFWHQGPLFENGYRLEGRAMSVAQIRESLQRSFGKDEAFYTASNERFRRNLYDIYLGGLDMEKFPRLFKRAIPFKMNIRLEEFVKEYICMEQDIHIEDMQESVILYGRMRSKIEEAMRETEALAKIRKEYDKYLELKKETEGFRYRQEKFAVLQCARSADEAQAHITQWNTDLEIQKKSFEGLEKQLSRISEEYDEINRQIAGSGYDKLEQKLQSLEDMLEKLEKSASKWERIAYGLSKWQEEDTVSNQMLWDIEKFAKGEITGEDLERLKKSLRETREEAEEQRQEAVSELRAGKKEEKAVVEELKELKQGRKAYPRELESARDLIRQRLYEKHKKNIPVRVLADLLEIRDESWENAVEGYLAGHKTALIVEPKYIKDAMEIYQELDQGRYWRVSLVDTKKVTEQEHTIKENALAQEVLAKEPYVQSFIGLLLGNVIKCDTTEELRNCRIGVTRDCMVYQNFQLRRMNPEQYTRRAYIGEKSMRQRIRELEERRIKLEQRRLECEKAAEDANRVLSYEYLAQPCAEYLDLKQDMEETALHRRKRDALKQKMAGLREESVERLLAQLAGARERMREKQAERDALLKSIGDREHKIQEEEHRSLALQEILTQKEKELIKSDQWEKDFADYMAGQKEPDYDRLLRRNAEAMKRAEQRGEEQYEKLVELRSSYLKDYPNRTFSAAEKDNAGYDALLEELQCDRIVRYRKQAAEQARVAAEHFKEDFIYKVRSAIKEAYIRRDELNHIIRDLNFGKDRYQFKITRNKGADGEYYDMFMDDSLEINPNTLTGDMDSQLNLFTMEHQNRYAVQMNDLIHIFIPPENAGAAQIEEAKRNMEKYADYRTYLSFEMEQIVEGEERLVIGLSKMIRKNSGGEGQNPLYVALLASFAQAYRITVKPNLMRRPTIRLVVLDEAFSKMDAEKVASCIELIRGLGFQAIISATNDKIQNYLENVDKTFVYANPNKKSIAVQEFEKKDFTSLLEEEY